MSAKTIPIERVMIAWNPGSRVVENGCNFMVIAHPDETGITRHMLCTTGACGSDWNEFHEAQRRAELILRLWKIVAIDRVPAREVHESMMVVPEYAEMFSFEDIYGDENP